MKKSIVKQIMVFTIGMLIACAIGIGAAGYFVFRSTAIKDNAERAQNIAQAAAAVIDGDAFEKSLETGEKDAAYHSAKAGLDHIKKETKVLYLYALDAHIDEEITYYAEGFAGEADEDPAFDLGETEDAAHFDEKMHETVETGNATTSKVYKSGEFGRMVTGFAPIRSSDGRIVGVIGADISLEEISKTVNRFGLSIVGIIVFCGILFGTIIIRLMQRILGKPIVKLTQMSDQLAEGNVDVEIERDREDEIGDLFDAFKRMTDNTKEQVRMMEALAAGNLDIHPSIRSDKDTMNIAINQTVDQLNDLFRDVIRGAEQVSAAAEQISATAQSLASSTNEQAATVEQFRDVVGQVHKKGEESTEQAIEAQESARKTNRVIVHSGDKMEELTMAMSEIDQSSQEISRIIKTIDDIAFQTNILALNAAVEAARAGQHGKGFAVVADEVRNLAAKSAEAAKETSQLIASSMEKVSGGNELTEVTRDGLGEVKTIVTETTQSMDRIKEAAIEQKRALQEINQAVEQITITVQSNSANAQESAATAEELAAQASALKDIVNHFQLKKEGHELSA
ncbi:methyl-accepting chemotaxis protein [Aequitasia blattaphilus]|uniref:Methyl-accepting chemotaxis protein n=1 Tax=Aequitasia blattaphilus TaxID=2949332 RepID=A0ABT1EER7_9FIRM|nr:methyl-accepting chemotaxis protein [Aequitasia blattaphilus]MCP1103427.1 methyl-accepting chemotaxis protein [Aequitasia blattaphilus]MCR8616067.1 methyl-accepting chemotaxis protein [Aequitasia blattaphilus]